MRLTKEQRLDMVQLGYNPLLDADIERFFAGQAPTMHRSQLYEGENHSMGQSHFTERDMGNVPEYSSMKIGQDIAVDPNEDVIRVPVLPGSQGRQQPQRQVLREDDDFGLPAPTQRQQAAPTASKEQLIAKGQADAKEYCRLFIDVLKSNQPRARVDLLNKLSQIANYTQKLDQNSKIAYNTGLAKVEKNLLSRFS